MVFCVCVYDTEHLLYTILVFSSAYVCVCVCVCVCVYKMQLYITIF